MTSGVAIPRRESADRRAIVSAQAARLRELLGRLHGSNAFYTRKLDEAGISVKEIDLPGDLGKLPLTTKSELIADQLAHPPWGTNFSEPAENYTRFCQTSSTTGTPLRWRDTDESWSWMLECWEVVYRAAGVTEKDRIFFAFSFGPFLGFWTAFDAGHRIGAHCIPGGGMSSHLRLRMIETIEPTVVCCTPTYALWLSEIAAGSQIAAGSPNMGRLSESSVRVLIVAGEPGGSIPATRKRIEDGWGARVIDHHGLTETGPLSFECWENPGGLHLNEGEYICEVLDPESRKAVPDGEKGELVVTNLGRTAAPVIRYRTGDIVVRRSDPCVCGRTWSRLEGGILARADDMINIRGVNVYPAAIESVVRQFSEIVEFRSTASRNGAMWTLEIEIEPEPGSTDRSGIPTRLTHRLREALGLTVPVRLVDPGALPRFEMKSKRFVVAGTDD